MKVNERVAGTVMLACLLVGSLGIGLAWAQAPQPSTPAATAQEESGPNDQARNPAYSSSIAVDEAAVDGMAESDESAALQKLATISADEARAAAVAANPGATAIKVELDNENGALVYSVELSNGLDVKVDAGNGQVVHTEQAGEDKEGVQADHPSQPGEVPEMPGTEDAAGA
jgi:uncharacterized membrane protein YkoI